MKNRILGITVFLALVALCMVFTACLQEDDSPITLIFTNNSSYDVFLTFSNPTGSKTLTGVTGAQKATTYEHPCTKKTTFGWALPNEAGYDKNLLVIAESNGAGLNFKNNPDGLIQNKVDTIELDD